MPKLRLLAVIACFSSVSLHAAADPRVYLQYDWYVVEMVVFERTDAPLSPENLVHGSEYRLFSADLRTISPSEPLQRHLAELVESYSVSDSQLTLIGSTDGGVNDSPRTDVDAASSTSKREQSSESMTSDEGCWLHREVLSLESFDTSRLDERESTIESLENSEENDLFNDQTVLTGDIPQPTRNPLLPDWLPDHWETEEVIMQRVGRVLGLCEEDLAEMISPLKLGPIQSDKEETAEIPLTAQVIEQEFSEYERELKTTAGTRRAPESWTLSRAANRLRNEGYRIIDHASWHQEALERGVTKPFLVQFGESRPNNRYEVEGTVELSLARFLHLDVDLWKSFEPDKSSDPLPRLLYYSLRENRRLTLGKTHYFDHPKFGLLVRIQRLPVPVELISLLDQLDDAF